MRPAPTRPLSRAAGFTLVEIVVVLLIVSVLIGMAAVMTRGVVAAQKRSLTAARLSTVDAALTQFVAQQRRLPCPANGTLAASANNAGVEDVTAGTCTGNQANGVVPWRTLGLSETDATDGWERRLTYRVDPLLTVAGGMDMSGCDAIGTAAPGAAPNFCLAGCVGTTPGSCTSPYLFLTNNNAANGRGLQVRNLAGQVLMNPTPGVGNAHTGAAYVVVSAGESGGGAYLNTGTLAASTVGDGTEELKNYASQQFVSNTVTYYVDDSIVDASGNGHFDDLVLRPSVQAVAARAGLGPRVH